jgi:hypothetical protein
LLKPALDRGKRPQLRPGVTSNGGAVQRSFDSAQPLGMWLRTAL